MVVINAFGNMFTYLFVLTNIINVVCGRQSKTRLLCLIQPQVYINHLITEYINNIQIPSIHLNYKYIQNTINVIMDLDQVSMIIISNFNICSLLDYFKRSNTKID